MKSFLFFIFKQNIIIIIEKSKCKIVRAHMLICQNSMKST